MLRDWLQTKQHIISSQMKINRYIHVFSLLLACVMSSLLINEHCIVYVYKCFHGTRCIHKCNTIIHFSSLFSSRTCTGHDTVLFGFFLDLFRKKTFDDRQKRFFLRDGDFPATSSTASKHSSEIKALIPTRKN